MDRRERYNDPEEVLRAALDGMQRGLWTALPGIIQSFNSAAMTVVVQPSVKAVMGLPDGSTQSVALPLLLDCPVVFPCGGGFTLTFPIVAGDECVVVFSSRCIDSWWQSGGVQEQAELRMHDLSDGFAFVGARSQPRVIDAISATGAQMRSDSGASFIEVSADTITIETTSDVIVNAPTVTVNATSTVVNCQTAEVNADTSLTVTSPLSTFVGNLIVTGTATIQGLLSYLAGLAGTGGVAGSSITGNITHTSGNLASNGVTLHTHTHSGVQTGSGNTGGPN